MTAWQSYQASILRWMQGQPISRDHASTGSGSSDHPATLQRITLLISALTSTPELAPKDKSRSALSALGFNLLLAVLIWSVWLFFGGPNALHDLLIDWKVALTMVFGSLVGGGTSEGGGAIAFPIITKLLHIAPYDARNLSLAIQSVGMGAASLSILYQRVPIERRALLYAGVQASPV